MCLASSERLYWLRDELCTLKLYLPKILSGGFLCGKSCVDALVEILLCEGGNVERGVRTSKRIFVFAFDPLSLSLSYILHCIILFISYICLVLIVRLTCVEPRELHIAPQLLFRGI